MKYCSTTSPFYKDLSKSFSYNRITFTALDYQDCEIMKANTRYILTEKTKFKKIYKIIRPNFENQITLRLNNSINRFNATAETLYKNLDLAWRIKNIPVHYKDMYYKLTFLVYRDRDWQARHSIVGVTSPTCRFCQQADENKEHLFFTCTKLASQRTRYNITNWQSIFSPNPTKQQLRKVMIYTCTILQSYDKNPNDAIRVLNYYLN